ncbi:MAG: hypothetical protein JNL58_26865 [Planctomyces sp.]|nr:hypothetical protein [Planctomyces sp.]
MTVVQQIQGGQQIGEVAGGVGGLTTEDADVTEESQAGLAVLTTKDTNHTKESQGIKSSGYGRRMGAGEW